MEIPGKKDARWKFLSAAWPTEVPQRSLYDTRWSEARPHLRDGAEILGENGEEDRRVEGWSSSGHQGRDHVF